MSLEPPSPPLPPDPPPLALGVDGDSLPPTDTWPWVYRVMLETRLVEARIVELYRQNVVTGGVYSGQGNEATSVGAAWPLRPHDVLVPTHRDLGAHLAHGHDADDIFLQYLKRGTSQTGGKDSGLHMGREGSNVVGMISHLAHMMPVAVGCALAERQLGRDTVVLTTVGDGATSLGDFHESLNFAAVQKLPVLFVIVNNQYAYSTPITLQYAVERLSSRAVGYGMAGETVDGTNVLAVLAAAERAYRRGRAGQGPTLLESVTMRMRGHSEHDDMRYVPKALVDAWRAWDPLRRFEAHLEAVGVLSAAEREAMHADLSARIDAAVERAIAAPLPDPHEAPRGVFRAWDDAWTPPSGEAWLARSGGGR
jgi:TPP-dependent pyruvate/acetoin dehydrogenase alpha subunit